MIRFYIYPSKMPTTLGKYIAKTLANNNITINELVDRVADAKTSLGQGDIRGVIETLCQVIEREVTTGNSVQLGGICQIRPSIKGTFDSINDGYNPERNSIEVAVAAGARLRKAVKDNAAVEKIGHSAPLPDLAEFYDVGTQTVNEEISVGNIGQISGQDLSFDAADPEQGLFIVDDVNLTPMQISAIQKATDGQIVFLNQAIAPTATSVHFLLRRRNKTDGPIIEAQSCELTVTA